MILIEKLKYELSCIEEGIFYFEQTDAAWSPEYTRLCKKRRILKRAIRKLEKLEVHKK